MLPYSVWYPQSCEARGWIQLTYRTWKYVQSVLIVTLSGMPAEKETMLSDPAEVHIKNAERKATATDQQDMTV